MNETAPVPAPKIPDPIIPEKQEPKPERASGGAAASAAIVTLIVAGIVGLSIWYLARPQPLIIQGEADATRVDIAARIDGRVGQRPVDRGQNVVAGQLLFEIDNPELVAKWRQSGLTVSVLLMESSILSEVHNTSILRTGLPADYTVISTSLAYQIAPPAPPLAPPRSGLDRSDFVPWRFSEVTPIAFGGRSRFQSRLCL